jgi:hypothetical protein
MAIYGDNSVNNDNCEFIDNKPTFSVKLEFTDIEAKNPLEAVKKVLAWIQNQDNTGGAETFIYDVLNEETLETFSVDLSEEEENQVYLNK